MTPQDLIKRALKKVGVIGVGQTPLAEDMNDAFDDLNGMLAQWNRKRWLITRLVDIAAPMTGAGFYRIGPGQSFDTPGRVTAIAEAYYRYAGSDDTEGDFSQEFGPDFGPPASIDPANIDVPLTVIRSREDYSRLGMKGAPGFPRAVFLDTGIDAGTLYVWPVPPVGSVHIVVQDTLVRFPDLTTEIDLPAEYEEAILYNLCGRIAPGYGKAPDPAVVALARAGLNTIRVANTQIGHLQMPENLPGLGWGADNNGFWAGGGVVYPPGVDPGPSTGALISAGSDLIPAGSGLIPAGVDV
jgi:hypothetical protein